MPETLKQEPLTDIELRAFSQKLAEWMQTLAPREQDFLVAMLRAAGGAGEDTAGHMLVLTALTLVSPPPSRHDTPKNAISNVR
ncbi:MAG: hypothetical protein AB7R89_14410 [Dehalococcoidia bacterium]